MRRPTPRPSVPRIPDASSWTSLRTAAANRFGHHAVQVEDPDRVATPVTTSSFIGAMSLGLDVVQGQLRLTAVPHGVRQDLVLTASDGLQMLWQQILVQRGDAVAIELVRLDPASKRGVGRGAHHFRNFMLWCEIAGIGSVSLDAGKSVGGYFWARCGFLPDVPTWNRMVAEWRSQAQRMHATDVLDLLNRLAPLGPMGVVYVAGSVYGKSLLLNTHWHGLLDLTNREQRDRARHYGHPTDL